MKICIKNIAATIFATAVTTIAANAGTIAFSGRNWTTYDQTASGQYSPAQNNTYTVVGANTGSIHGRYGVDSIMVTALTLGVDDSVSYDYYLSNNNPGFAGANGGTYYGDWTSEFQDGTGFYDAWGTARTYSASNANDNHIWISLNSGDDYFGVTSGLSTGVHIVFTFHASSYTIAGTSIANPADLRAVARSYWNGGVSDIQSFRAGLWDSEQTATVANFTVTRAPEPGTIPLLGLGALGIFLARRRLASPS